METVWGGLVSLRAFSREILAIAMTGGVTGPMKFNWDKLLTQEQKQKLQTHGWIPVRDSHNMHRKEVRLDKDFLDEFEKINQKDMLERVTCPVLMIHGDGDEQERSGYQLSQLALKHLPEGSDLRLFPGVGHGFWGYIDEISDLLAKWFSKYLK